MNAFEFLVCRHTFDGLRLAGYLHQHEKSREAEPVVILAPGADPTTASKLSMDPEENSLGHLLSPPSDEDSFRPLSVASDWGRLANGVETLDELRRSLPERENPYFCLISLDRLEQDLTRMRKIDRITFFWAARDMLSNSYLDSIEYATERMEMESPQWGGFYLYYYQDDQESLERTRSLQSFLSDNLQMGTIELPEVHPWHQKASL